MALVTDNVAARLAHEGREAAECVVYWREKAHHAIGANAIGYRFIAACHEAAVICAAVALIDRARP